MTTNKLEIYRGESLHLTVDIDERTQFSHTLNAEHKITAVFVSPTRLDLQTEDYIIHNGERYSMNLPPSYRKSAKITFLYTCEFEHIFYKTHNKLFMHLGSADFSFFGDATAHMQLVVDNLNEISPSGWTLGAMASTEPRLITYVNNEQGFSCRNAIAIIAETFGLEIHYDGQQIGLVERVGVNTNISFEYGRGDGMYALSRLTPDNYLPANKIYVFGGKTNIPFDYRGGSKRLVFADRFVTRPLEPGEPVIEGVRFYDDIFPERTSSFGSVSGDGLLLTDSTIDFDINDHLIAGVVASVVFKSGHLMGNEFEIESYDHTTKTIKIIQDVDENGYILPNAVVQPESGDLYTLTGISLPQSYVDAAEIRLKERGDDDISQPERLPYEIEIDEKFMRDNGLSLNVGDRVLIKDDDLGVDDTIRMSSIQYPLVNPDKIKAEISDKVLYTKVDRVIKDQKRENDIIIRKQTQDYDTIRRNMLRFKQMYDLVFDPDGYFDPERIKPFSIETYLLSVGAQSQNFGLNGVTISTNNLGDPNEMLISSGDLVHYTLEIEGLGYIWTLPQSTFSLLDPAKSYYVYARCSRTVLTGEWMISETPVLAEDQLYPGMWNFNLGILFDVKEGRRDFEFTKGMTFIVGDTIKTGRVQDHSGNSYLDLDTGQFKIGNNEEGLDWGVTVPNTLTIKGGLVQNGGGAVSPIGVDRGTWAASPVVYYPGDRVFWAGGTWRYTGMTPSATGEPGVDPLWEVFAAAGEQGEDGITITLSPSGYIFKGSETSALPDGLTVNVQARRGATSLPVTVTQVGGSPTGMTVNISGSNIFISVNASFTSASGALIFNVSTDGKVFTQYFSYAIAFKGVDGADGADGAAGPRGPSLAYQGWYNAATQYYGNDLRIDAVRYGSSYYFAKPDAPVSPFSGILPTNTNYWTSVGATFESIATGLLLAELAYITNLGARYIQTDVIGQKRIEINERRERKNASGAGTGVWVDQNNVALFAANNTKLAEIDDDSSPGRGVFYLEFADSNLPSLNLFRGETKERNWSQYNTGSFDSRTGTTGDFSNGFPRFIFDLITQPISGGRTRYYFRRAEQGFNASDPNADSALSPNTSISPTLSNLNNTAMWGAVSRGHTRVLTQEVGLNEYQLDGGSVGLNLLDSDIILLDSTVNRTFTMPRFINGGVVDQNVIDRCMYGREVRIINKTTSRVITINASGSGDNIFIGDGGLETATVAVSQGMTVTLKLISKTSLPTSIPNWRWAVILRGYNQYMGT